MAIKTMVGGGFDAEHPHTNPWWQNTTAVTQTGHVSKNVQQSWADNRHGIDRYKNLSAVPQRAPVVDRY